VNPSSVLEELNCQQHCCENLKWCLWEGRHAPKGEPVGLQPPTQNWNLDNTDFAHMTQSNTLHDWPFSKNEPLKLADD
jgi:hypothetical protein